MKNENKTHVIRFGGMVETFYICPGHSTCHISEATAFDQSKAEAIAKELQREYSFGVRAVPVNSCIRINSNL